MKKGGLNKENRLFVLNARFGRLSYYLTSTFLPSMM